MQDLHEAWGERVEELCIEHGLSHRQLARRCGVHPTTIDRIVKGLICPDDELKWKIAGAFSQRMDRIWEWPKVVPPAPDEAVA